MDRPFAPLKRIAPRLALVLMAGASLAACATSRPKMVGQVGSTRAPPPSAFIDRDTGKALRGTMKPYQVRGLWYYPAEQPDYDVVGVGSWYGEQFHNKKTSNGEIFDMDRISAAHKTLPLPSLVEVTNLDNGRAMVLRVNDRGPFVDDRVIDLSRAAADQLGYRQKGVAKVRVRYLGPAEPSKIAPRLYQVAAAPPLPEDPLTPEQRFPVRRQVLGETAGFRVQAGSFSTRDNAQRAADQIAAAGNATIEPMDRGGATLYRVTIGPAPDEAQAWVLRDQVAALGFRDASVLRP